MKQFWDQKDPEVVNKNHRLTTVGWNTIWSSVDHAIQYFDEKVIPSKIEKAESNKFFPNRTWSEASKKAHRPDNSNHGRSMHEKSSYDRSHWHRNDRFKTEVPKKRFGYDNYDHYKKREEETRRHLPTPPPKKK